MSYSTFRVFGLVSPFFLQFLLMPTNIWMDHTIGSFVYTSSIYVIYTRITVCYTTNKALKCIVLCKILFFSYGDVDDDVLMTYHKSCY